MNNNDKWQLIIGNIGTVYSGSNGFEAKKLYNQYVAESKTNLGRCGGELITLLCENEINSEYVPKTD